MNIWEELDKISYRKERLSMMGETEETLLEMAHVGTIDGTIIIKIYSGEGPVPHFHFYEAQSRRKGCLKILEASYFIHGKYLDDLKRDERKELLKWLNERNEDSNTTNWEAICRLWNMNNPTHKINISPLPKIPDYMRI